MSYTGENTNIVVGYSKQSPVLQSNGDSSHIIAFRISSHRRTLAFLFFYANLVASAFLGCAISVHVRVKIHDINNINSSSR